MIIELIPVIEITYFNEVPSPGKGPYWENEDEWENYAEVRLKKAGFKDRFETYKKGSSFYEPSKISLSNLKKIIIDWFEAYDGSNIDDILPLYGGYVLKIVNEEVYFPQCCGDLGDIVYWEKMIEEKKNCNYNGHPAPLLTFSDSEIAFTFNESDEEFSPPVPRSLRLKIDQLEKALEGAKIRLKEFEKNIEEVENEIGIELDGQKLTEILIYRNQEINT